MSTITATPTTTTTLKEDTATIEKMYGASNPTKRDTIIGSTSPRRHYRGQDIKVSELPPDVNNMVNKGLFALAFFVAILSGMGVGMSMILKYKLWLLLAIIFILIVVLSPDISDYAIYGLGEYIDLGYTGFKNVTNNMFLKMKKNKNSNSPVESYPAQPAT